MNVHRPCSTGPAMYTAGGLKKGNFYSCSLSATYPNQNIQLSFKESIVNTIGAFFPLPQSFRGCISPTDSLEYLAVVPAEAQVRYKL